MANDPGLANDSCIFMEAIRGDNGVHDGNRVWWLSPDITVSGASTPSGFTESGPVKVKFHRKPASSNCQFPGDESVSVQLWVAKPSLVIVPDVTGSAQLVQFIGSPIPAEGGNHTQQIALTPIEIPGEPPVPVISGPKTFVARCFPESGSPSSKNFFLPDDQHVALRNIFVTSTTRSSVTFKINTVNPAIRVTPLSKVKLRAVLDLAPETRVRKTAVAMLQSIDGFQQFRTEPLVGGFKFDLTGFTTSNVIDPLTQPPLIPPSPTPTFEAQVDLPVRQVAQLVFSASLKKVAAGELCIFHLTQLSTANASQGGLTLLVLKL